MNRPAKETLRWRGIAAALIWVMGTVPAVALSEAATVDLTYRQLMYGVHRRLPGDRIDEDNVLRIPRNEWVVQARPDARLLADPFTLSVRPRLDGRYREYGDGAARDTSETEGEFYFQEFRVQVEPVDYLYVSAGREALLWGPSFLLSPSNPFDPATGRLEPKGELPPSDYVTAQWIPLPDWSAALMANTGEGRREGLETFREGLALKVDMFRDAFHGAAILSKREGEDARVGGFGVQNVSEAALAYVEVGAGRDDAVVLAGVRYTTWQRWMCSAEYLYNSRGDRHAPVSALVPDVDALYPEANGETMPTVPFLGNLGATRTPGSGGLPGWADVTGSGWVRRHYLLLQAAYPQWRRRVDWLLQGVYNIDDRSSRSLLYAECEVGRHLRVFAGGIVYHGDRESEFGSVLERVLMGGVEWVF